MARYQGAQFALCGSTLAAVERNLLTGVLPALREMGFDIRERRSEHRLTVRFGGRENVFFLYGGRNEGSATLIQGITLAGVLLDEAALMPRSFVEQAAARCSVPGSKLWFSCNPEGPAHWFYREWVCRAAEKKMLHLHFTMEDNPGLSSQVRERYARMFQGSFYRRFVLGQWTATEGLVYDFWDESWMEPAPEDCQEWRISCDYGTVNPTSFGLWGRKGEIWYRTAEYYYDARAEGRQKTDGEYARDLLGLAGTHRVTQVVADPSAASFLEELRRRGLPVRGADNGVLTGIRTTAQLLREKKLVICKGCDAAAREFALYRWDRAADTDRVIKEHDHAMDEIRYFAMSLKEREPLAAGYVERQAF